jgi:hypothetical protein
VSLYRQYIYLLREREGRMRLRSTVAAMLAGLMPVAPLAIAAQSPPIAPRICAAVGVNPRLVAHIPNVKSARMYFNAEPSGPEYYVDMHPGMGDLWWVMLPTIDPSTKAITYRAAVPDANKGWTKGRGVTVATTTACPPSQLTPAELEAANNLVIGLTSAGESPVPVGFTCRGIKAVIDVNGQMRPADECRRVLAATGLGAGPTSASSSHLAPGVVIAAAVVGGGVLGYVAGKNRRNNNPVSNSRP